MCYEQLAMTAVTMMASKAMAPKIPTLPADPSVRSAPDINVASTKPDEQVLRKTATQYASTQGATNLTGPGGIGAEKLNLGKTNLLGL